MRQMDELPTVVARDAGVDRVGGLWWSWQGHILVAENHSFLPVTHALASVKHTTRVPIF